MFFLANIDSRGNSRRGKKTGYGSGKETLRLKADGKAQVQQVVIDFTVVILTPFGLYVLYTYLPIRGILQVNE